MKDGVGGEEHLEHGKVLSAPVFRPVWVRTSCLKTTSVNVQVMSGQKKTELEGGLGNVSLILQCSLLSF